MKKLIIVVILAFTATYSHAQYSVLQSWIDGFRTFNNSDITTKTADNSVSPVDVGGNIDSVARYMKLIIDSLATGAATNLQAVTTAGNTTTNNILMSNGAYTYWYKPSSPTTQQMYARWDGLYFYINDGANSATSQLYFPNMGSGNIRWVLPDEPVNALTNYWKASLVTHWTKDSICVRNSDSSIKNYMTYGGLKEYKGDSLQVALYSDGSNNRLFLRNGTGTTYYNEIYSGNNTYASGVRDTLSSTPGYVAMRRDTVHDATSDMPRLITDYRLKSDSVSISNKRIKARYVSAATSTAPTINTDNLDTYELTAQASDINFTTNLSGTPYPDDIFHVIVTGTGTHTITWGSSFENSLYITLPTTVSTATVNYVFTWDAINSKWKIANVY